VFVYGDYASIAVLGYVLKRTNFDNRINYFSRMRNEEILTLNGRRNKKKSSKHTLPAIPTGLFNLEVIVDIINREKQTRSVWKVPKWLVLDII